VREYVFDSLGSTLFCPVPGRRLQVAVALWPCGPVVLWLCDPDVLRFLMIICML
jgi:hypothetical protein